IAVRAARAAAIAVGRGVAWIQLDGARVVRNGGGVIAFRVSGGAAVGPCAAITRGKQNGLIVIGQSFFVPAFVTPGVTASEAHLDMTRIEFDGAVEVAQGGFRISGAEANQAAIIPSLARLRIERESALRVLHRSARIAAE